MKKTITVNLNGRVFTIDEDAYRLLDNYLNNLRIYFRKEEGSSEIIADFEARIEELFSEKTRLGYQVITIEQVEEVITRVGRPGDFADREDAENTEEKEDKQTYFTESKEIKKKFFRNLDDKMFGGVCSGIAAYFGWGVLAVRIITIILVFAMPILSGGHRVLFIAPVFAPFWVVPFLYLLAWIIFPGAHTAEQKLQMRGKPITVENIGKTVAAEAVTVVPPARPKGCLASFVDLIVGLIKVVLIGLGCLIVVPLLFALFITIIVLIALLFGAGGNVADALPSFLFVNHPVLATITFLLVLGIPVIALIYTLIAHLANWKPINRPVKWTFLLVWIIALVFFLFSIFSVFRFGGNNWGWKWQGISNYHPIRGNGIHSERTYVLNAPVTNVEMNGNLYANLQIEQMQNDTAVIVISGDENLVDQVKYDLQDGRLTFSSDHPLNSENNLTIRLQTNSLKGIRSNVLGNIEMNRAFTGNELEIKMSGPTRFSADSLFLQSLNVRSEGIASIRVAGKAKKASFDLGVAGKIEAFELLSDTVYAHVDGVGFIQCNPVDYLEGRVNGVGKITYKEEPKTRDVSSSGFGKIGKE